MTLKTYTIKSGPYKGLVHVRGYLGAVNGRAKYYHIGRFKSEEVPQILAKYA